jgi:hypothetical protein
MWAATAPFAIASWKVFDFVNWYWNFVFHLGTPESTVDTTAAATTILLETSTSFESTVLTSKSTIQLQREIS